MLTGNAPASYNIVLLFAGFVKGLAVFFPLYPLRVSLFLLYTNFPYFLTHFSKCDTIKQVKKRGICFMYYLCYALLYCIIFAFGAAIGIFLNVCIYRLPKEESLWRNNSHCMTCGTPIRRNSSTSIFASTFCFSVLGNVSEASSDCVSTATYFKKRCIIRSFIAVSAPFCLLYYSLYCTSPVSGLTEIPLTSRCSSI